MLAQSPPLLPAPLSPLLPTRPLPVAGRCGTCGDEGARHRTAFTDGLDSSISGGVGDALLRSSCLSNDPIARISSAGSCLLYCPSPLLDRVCETWGLSCSAARECLALEDVACAQSQHRFFPTTQDGHLKFHGRPWLSIYTRTVTGFLLWSSRSPPTMAGLTS